MADIPANVLLDDLHPSRFLKVTDLTERWNLAQITVTISRLTYEETVPVPSDIDPDTRKPRITLVPVLYFLTKNGTEFPRGMLLSAKENVRNLKAVTGAKTVGDLIGKRVIITVGEHKRKAVLRISESAPATE